jgi:L-2-hydroxyglutarate oxidase LhgO
MYDVAIVGGGIVGLAVAWQTLKQAPDTKVAVLEAESELATHQTGHNSGVVHAGVYYTPGSQKALLCVRGKSLLEEFCERRGIPLDHNGKLIVATREDELDRLADLYIRARKNGVPSLRRLDGDEMRHIEPSVRGVAAIHSPRTGVVDFVRVATELGAEIKEMGGSIFTSWRVVDTKQDARSVEFMSKDSSVRARYGVACAGLQADRLAGVDDIRIVPFRGSWYVLGDRLAPEVRGSIYPVPDPSLPFLGVHLTRRIDGQVWAGPNAFLAFSRDRYKRWAIKARDVWSALSYPGTWRVAGANIGSAWNELTNDVFTAAYAREVRNYLPDVKAGDLTRGPMGIRAQAIARNGEMLDDFVIREDQRMTHVLNAPSPAATSSLAIGESITRTLLEKLRTPTVG